MFEYLLLENFKGFKKRTRIDLAPITLIFGENNAGKSSILQSLYLLKEAIEDDHPVNPRASKIKEIRELGSYEDCVTDKLSPHEKLTLGFGIIQKWCWEWKNRCGYFNEDFYKLKNHNSTSNHDKHNNKNFDMKNYPIEKEGPGEIADYYHCGLSLSYKTVITTGDGDWNSITDPYLCECEYSFDGKDEAIYKFSDVYDWKKFFKNRAREDLINEDDEHYLRMYSNEIRGKGVSSHPRVLKAEPLNHKFYWEKLYTLCCNEQFRKSCDDLIGFIVPIVSGQPDNPYQGSRIFDNEFQQKRYFDILNFLRSPFSYEEFYEKIITLYNNQYVFDAQGLPIYSPEYIAQNNISDPDDVTSLGNYFELVAIVADINNHFMMLPSLDGLDLPPPIIDEISKTIYHCSALGITSHINEKAKGEFKKLHAIGPIRFTPETSYKSVFYDRSVGFRGENTPAILYQLYKNSGLNDVNQCLKEIGLGYEIKINQQTKFSPYEINLFDQETDRYVNISNVGKGISQSLPIIIQGITASHSVITIEQPELHIHPRLQANLGEIICKSAKKNQNQFIIETHSEHLILRIQKLIREKELSPKEVCILYVDKDQDGSYVNRLKLDEDGDFIDDWPKGFFTERLDELI